MNISGRVSVRPSGHTTNRLHPFFHTHTSDRLFARARTRPTSQSSWRWYLGRCYCSLWFYYRYLRWCVRRVETAQSTRSAFRVITVARGNVRRRCVAVRIVPTINSAFCECVCPTRKRAARKLAVIWYSEFQYSRSAFWWSPQWAVACGRIDWLIRILCYLRNITSRTINA